MFLSRAVSLHLAPLKHISTKHTSAGKLISCTKGILEGSKRKYQFALLIRLEAMSLHINYSMKEAQTVILAIYAVYIDLLTASKRVQRTHVLTAVDSGKSNYFEDAKLNETTFSKTFTNYLILDLLEMPAIRLF